MAFGCKLSLTRWQKSLIWVAYSSYLSSLALLLVQVWKGECLLHPKPKIMLEFAAAVFARHLSAQESAFTPVDLDFLLYLSPPPSFLFNTYVVVERKYNMILGLAFQFHCIFMGQAESQLLELLG